MMSAKRWIGALGGTNRLGVDVSLHARFQRTVLDKFDRVAQHPRDRRTLNSAGPIARFCS